MSKSLRIAFDRRQTGDYGEITEIDKQTAQDTMESAKEFVSEIEEYLVRSKLFP